MYDIVISAQTGSVKGPLQHILTLQDLWRLWLTKSFIWLHMQSPHLTLQV